MAWGTLKVLAVVPARGGSKGIPRKNLCQVGGRSLIAHAGATVKALPWIDHAIISTDDAAMLEEGKQYGLDAPFLRPSNLAQDTTTAVDTWRHAWLASEAVYNCQFDLSVWLQPTTPLRTPEEVERTVQALVEGHHQAAATISRVPGHFTPQKILTVDGQHLIHYYLQDGAQHTGRQTIPAYYYRNGICYAVTRATLIDKGLIIEQDCVGVLIDRPILNIDEPLELALADLLASQSSDQASSRPG
ncbi:MAG TPA: acylneuraminate cytidylyltransferase family protein [Nitrospirales bacterium]|nr:acylneuraminate cytidylyltransferase family protein [Nitrospirales bacterium]